MKQHLAGAKGNISSCLKVPADVKFLMQKSLEENAQKAKEKRGGTSGLTLHDLDEGEEDEVQEIDQQMPQTKGVNRKASSSSDNIYSYFKKGINDPSQSSIKSAMQSKERLHDTDLALALWFYNACILMNAVNSPLFPIAMSKVASMGHGYTRPSCHAMRVTLLRDAKQSVQLIVESYKKFWSEIGCTIMSDGWRDTRHRPLINFLVYCPKGISFIKYVDASDIESDAITLSNLFAEIIEIVGPRNVVHFNSRKATRPDEWWKLLGGDTPELQEFAVRILSQTTSSFGCERNWSVFERIHTKRRNWLEHKRLNDLVYIHYNMRLQNRLQDNKRSYDPVDYESTDKTEF